MFTIIVPVYPPEQIEVFKNGEQFEVEKLDKTTWIVKDLIVRNDDTLIVNHIYESTTVEIETNY